MDDNGGNPYLADLDPLLSTANPTGLDHGVEANTVSQDLDVYRLMSLTPEMSSLQTAPTADHQFMPQYTSGSKQASSWLQTLNETGKHSVSSMRHIVNNAWFAPLSTERDLDSHKAKIAELYANMKIGRCYGKNEMRTWN